MITIHEQPTGMILDSDFIQYDVEFKISNQIEILYSSVSMQQVPKAPLSFLGGAASLVMSSTGIVSIPFLIQEKQAIQIRLVDQKNNLISLQFLDNAQGYYLFEQSLQLEYPVEALTLEIIGKQTIVKQIRILKNKRFKPLNIRFKNQFGAILYTQLFASIKIEEELNYSTIRNQNGGLLTNEINSLSNLTVNTGYLLNSEFFVVSQICNSLQVEVEIEGTYIQVVPTQKKFSKFESNKWVMGTQLTFQYLNYEAN